MNLFCHEIRRNSAHSKELSAATILLHDTPIFHSLSQESELVREGGRERDRQRERERERERESKNLTFNWHVCECERK